MQVGFQNKRKITDAALPEKIRTIGSYAFARCSKLKHLTVPTQVTKIGAYAFKGDKNLKKLTVESGKLTKNNVKKSLADSSVNIIQLTKAAKNKKGSYKKIFAASNSGKKVTIR